LWACFDAIQVDSIVLQFVVTNVVKCDQLLFCICFPDGLSGWSDISSLSASCVSLEDDTTVFTGVTYLGSALVDAPRSQTEITRNMVVLNSQHGMAIPVSLSVPGHSEGIVR
jgi:hypothetical protein